MNRRLYRSRDERMLAGVAGGLAELWGADPSVVRIVWAVLVPFTGGIALLIYVVMAFVVPEEDELAPQPPLAAGATDSATDAATGAGDPTAAGAAPVTPPDWRSARRQDRAARRAARRAGSSGPGNAGLLIGALLVIAGVYFLVREYIPTIDTNWLWPAALIVLGVVVLASAFRGPPTDRTPPGAPR